MHIFWLMYFVHFDTNSLQKLFCYNKRLSKQPTVISASHSPRRSILSNLQRYFLFHCLPSLGNVITSRQKYETSFRRARHSEKLVWIHCCQWLIVQALSSMGFDLFEDTNSQWKKKSWIYTTFKCELEDKLNWQRSVLEMHTYCKMYHSHFSVVCVICYNTLYSGETA